MWVYASGMLLQRSAAQLLTSHLATLPPHKAKKCAAIEKMEEETLSYRIGSYSHHSYQRGLHLGVGTGSILMWPQSVI